MSAAPSSDRLPQIGKYELLEELGHGGMATVYRARDPRLERDVAVKLIHTHLREHAEVRSRFVAEAKAVAKLRHPGIVDVYDVAEDDDPERYLVVELIRGTTLRKLLDSHPTMPAEIVAILGSILCDAVQHAHDAGVIHRDIKPENVLVEIAPPPGDGAAVPAARASNSGAAGSDPQAADRSGTSSSRRGRVRVKLTDFGIAKVLDAQGVTSTGQILGSPAHMAPEQIEAGEIGPHTDVFALGVLMYECMVGHLPFHGSNPAQVLRRVLGGTYDAPDAERPEIGARWAAILAGALQHEIANRTKSAAELAESIARELTALGIDDRTKWLEDYFASPDEARAELVASIVPRLIERGEREHRNGAALAAAGDLNRALALRPHDLAILKRVGTLARARAMREWVRKAVLLAACASLVGVLAFGTTRLVKSQRARGDVVPVIASAPLVATAEPATPAVTSAPASASSGSEARGAEPATVSPTSSALVAVSRGALDARVGRVQRRVRFHATPEGARLTLNGTELAWFGQVHVLAPGSYSVTGAMPADVPCCEPVTLGVTVTAPPKEAPDELQTVAVPLTIKPARAMLAGSPAGSSMTCDNGLTVAQQGIASVRMTRVEWAGACSFSPGGTKRRVTLRAGELTKVSWPR